MKLFLKTILKIYLKFFTRLIILIKRPVVIAIAGSTNKSFTRDEIKKQLTDLGLSVRTNPKSFNTEIGLPLAILGLESGYNQYSRWIPAIIGAPASIFKSNFPKYLILELGISGPGDMKYLLSVVKPHIAVITDITQRYIDSFAGMDRLVGEYEYLAKKVSVSGQLILNFDNYRVRSMASFSNPDRPAISIGTADGVVWQAKDIIKNLHGQMFTVSHDGNDKNIRIPRYGIHHIYALLAGLAIKNYVSNIKPTKDNSGKAN